MPEKNNIEIRSEEVREILGSPPGWIIRSSTSIILLVVVALLAGSYFYSYPDIVNGRVTIISENPPIPIIAKSNGRLELLLVEDGQQVKTGQIIGIIENPAVFDDMLKLNGVLDSLAYFFNSPAKLLQLNFPEQLNLGQCQSFYSSLINQCVEYRNFVRLDYMGQQQKSLLRQMADYAIYKSHLRNQCEIQKKDLGLSMKQLIRDSVLFGQQVISEAQHEQSQAAYYKQEYSYKSTLSNLSNTQIQIGQLEQKVLEVLIQKEEQEKRLLSVLKEKYDNLVAQYSSWEQTFVLKASIEGNIAFTDLWSENQPVQAGDNVFTVVPLINQSIIGKLIIPLTGSGKVEVGQKVNIKLDNYPYLEYGLIESTIDHISIVPVTKAEGAYYTAELTLNKGLVTNYNKELPFTQESQGTAEIIAKDRRLIERLINPLKALMDKVKK